MSRPQCLALLGSVAVGPLGFTRAALPVIWPVDFLLHGEQVVIGTGRVGRGHGWRRVGGGLPGRPAG